MTSKMTEYRELVSRARRGEPTTSDEWIAAEDNDFHKADYESVRRLHATGAAHTIELKEMTGVGDSLSNEFNESAMAIRHCYVNCEGVPTNPLSSLLRKSLTEVCSADNRDSIGRAVAIVAGGSSRPVRPKAAIKRRPTGPLRSGSH